jgi:hypothetical protein
MSSQPFQRVAFSVRPVDAPVHHPAMTSNMLDEIIFIPVNFRRHLNRRPNRKFHKIFSRYLFHLAFLAPHHALQQMNDVILTRAVLIKAGQEGNQQPWRSFVVTRPHHCLLHDPAFPLLKNRLLFLCRKDHLYLLCAIVPSADPSAFRSDPAIF